ncbi:MULTISPECIES: glycoside hydrolase family 130 protein [Robiginitalea]|uniref:Glycosidase n=1 Tax=Robiginitalea biformata (strain ATCC BAA-864 / DSM 15991 / KCTC 12146 / HTCC2501) TaxID=313596 RepID=A4CK84_ROBBH|nr:MULTISPECIES: glycoside hydrolase family 130 protein [Robiginitalea]EAR15283.1 hypothetical protein RB2501_13184 [Robiginitalea biformata HTCC2501]MDC6353781.1 glycoside hydrolase family 130 protein [Robiginitalea sp. PM2]MDC6374048.1 glycoside hydrolase family 130 protein [Robiginitalea sp. SP8]
MKQLSFILMCLSCAVLPAQEPWLLGFEKPEKNPILEPDSTARFFCPMAEREVRWQQADVFNPGAVVRNDTVFLLFRAEDDPTARLGERTSRIGLAWSTDGLNFTRYPDPVLYPQPGVHTQWDYPGGVEDPRVVELEDGTYLMLYTSWNRDVARLSSATSPDLVHWQKHGPVFEEAHGGAFLDHWSKSGSVVTELRDGRLVAKKIDGQYYMYWGELFVNVATSEDGKDWTPLTDGNGDLIKPFVPTTGRFDSHLTEPGPPALYTDAGILLLYNGKNLSGEGAGSETPEGSYCGGQALFSRENPARFLRRLETPFICPSLPHEVSGQYQAGTTFIEGLVRYKGRWLLYYGTADSMVGVAVSDQKL